MPQKDDVYTITDANTLSTVPAGMTRGRSSASRDSGSWGGDGTRSRHYRVSSSRPPKASSMSLFLWGTGQMYNEQRELGCLLLLTQGLAVAGHWCLAMIWPSICAMVEYLGVTEWHLLLTVAGLDLGLIFLLVTNVYHAYHRAEGEDGAYDGCEIPLLSGFASLVVPGWGQLLNAQPGKAMVFLFSLCAGLGTAALMMLTPFLDLLSSMDQQGILRQKADIGALALLGIAGTMWVLSVYDAVVIARCQRRMG